MSLIGNGWDKYLEEETTKPYFRNLMNFLDEEYANNQVFPPRNEIYTALQLTDYDDVKVVILGQDPYHDEGQAHGLAFSVKPGNAIPPSLRNIYKEISMSLGTIVPKTGYLVSWAKQGVLLMNTVLTVRAHSPQSHQNKGWEEFTSKVVSALNDREKPVIFVLWGSNAKKYEPLITNPQHIILKSVHPSPLSASRGFFGCGHFKTINETLKANGEKEIDWSIKSE